MVKIAISGPMCSGKSTIAKYICELILITKFIHLDKKLKI